MGTNSTVTLSRMAIYFMIGGAGGAFSRLFKDSRRTYYDPLLKLINQVLISGSGFRYRRTVSLLNIKLLISCLERHR